ncbi:uncharacterized protein LOC104906300 [Beta vulgaris subsp. vulgaris]|uniref:uncharacterized protein LOC104906300 n=1 Tax=Beta vulgaris subsp. vulgaris TaxID=3555 RepID=UPI0005401E6D|nr:uncharacterized protein LOC104906300 [Beta vulgaris subsp. vulgaris]
MAVMSHRHTADFRKLREGLKEKTKLAKEQAKEIEVLSKSLEDEKAVWASEKAAFENRIKDLTSQRDSVQRKRDEIIEEWKTSKSGLEFAANMGLKASEVAAREAVDRLQNSFRKVYPQANWSPIEAEYNISVDAAFHEGNEASPVLEVDDAIDVAEILGEDPQQAGDPQASVEPGLSIRVLALARRSAPGLAPGTASREISWDERNDLVNRLHLSELRLSEAQESMANSMKAFEEKMAELEQARDIALKQRDSASKRPRAAAKDCKRAEEKIEKTRKSAEEAIAKARECREAVVLDWKESEEGRTFLEDASLQASEIGQTEALRKVRLVLEKLAPSLPWSEVEEGVKALSQEEGPVEDQVPRSANLEG